MKIDFQSVLTKEEAAALSLRATYAKYGYAQYRMSKFEEYDLYVKNKDFLVSENVITFTDTDGRLMALKPDVTLSIIKNVTAPTDGVKKVYYHENVYRVSKGTKSFKEIAQVGLEVLGDVDEKSIAEVLFLAAKSLESVSEEYVLEVSHQDIVAGVLQAFGASGEGRKKIVRALGEKNAQAVENACKEDGMDEAKTQTVRKLVTTYGKPQKVAAELEGFVVDEATGRAVAELKSLLSALGTFGVSDKICVDFSVVNDMGYYNGVAFKGFVNGIPTGILSGGQYDGLMKKMKKSAKAIGFAVYLDELERLGEE